jgi:hypothetical protein
MPQHHEYIPLGNSKRAFEIPAERCRYAEIRCKLICLLKIGEDGVTLGAARASCDEPPCFIVVRYERMAFTLNPVISITHVAIRLEN